MQCIGKPCQGCLTRASGNTALHAMHCAQEDIVILIDNQAEQVFGAPTAQCNAGHSHLYACCAALAEHRSGPFKFCG